MHILGNYNKLAGLFLLAILIFAGNVTLFADLAKSQDNHNIESIYFNHDNTITVICKDRRNICFYRDEFNEKFNSLCKLDDNVNVWHAEFFNSINFAGCPVWHESYRSFPNFATESVPLNIPTLKSDQVSVRISNVMWLNEGRYRFSFSFDDALKANISSCGSLDLWSGNDRSGFIDCDINGGGRFVDIDVYYYENGGTALLNLDIGYPVPQLNAPTHFRIANNNDDATGFWIIWDNVQNAKSYEVDIFFGKNTSGTRYGGGTLSTNINSIWIIKQIMFNHKDINYRVRAIGENNQISPWSEFTYFNF